MENHPDALRADLQRYYGVDIDHAMAGEHTAAHVAVLAAYLPSDAAIRVEMDEDAVWTLDRALLASVVNYISAFAHGGKKSPYIGPKSGAPKSTVPAMAMSADELMEKLSRPRR